MRDGELFHGSGEWAWAAGIAPLLGPWRYGAVALVQARKGGYDPEEHLRFLAKHGVENMFTTPTALRAMTGVADAGKRYPLEKLRVTCSAGEPLNPEVIRWFRDQYGITVLDFYGLTESYPLCGNFPTVEVREGSMGRPMPGWEVAILDEDENGRWRRASAARSAYARARTRTTRSATGTGPRTPRRCSGATGSTPRTPRAWMRTATSGTPAAPTT